MTFTYICDAGHVTEKDRKAVDSMILCRVCGELAFRDPRHARTLQGVTRG